MGCCKQKQRGLRGLLCRWPSLLNERSTSLLSPPPVSEMTYTVSSGTLNSTIPYHRVTSDISSYLGRASSTEDHRWAVAADLDGTMETQNWKMTGQTEELEKPQDRAESRQFTTAVLAVLCFPALLFYPSFSSPVFPAPFPVWALRGSFGRPAKCLIR